MNLTEQIRERMKRWTSSGNFDQALAEATLIEAGDGRARIRLPIGREVQNVNGVLHGGAAATLVDVIGTIAIMTADRQHRPGVTTDLNVSYFAPGQGAVIAEARVLKSGRTLAFVAVDVTREEDGALVAQGRMTKHLGEPK